MPWGSNPFTSYSQMPYGGGYGQGGYGQPSYGQGGMFNQNALNFGGMQTGGGFNPMVGTQMQPPSYQSPQTGGGFNPMRGTSMGGMPYGGMGGMGGFGGFNPMAYGSPMGGFGGGGMPNYGGMQRAFGGMQSSPNYQTKPLQIAGPQNPASRTGASPFQPQGPWTPQSPYPPPRPAADTTGAANGTAFSQGELQRGAFDAPSSDTLVDSPTAASIYGVTAPQQGMKYNPVTGKWV